MFSHKIYKKILNTYPRGEVGQKGKEVMDRYMGQGLIEVSDER